MATQTPIAPFHGHISFKISYKMQQGICGDSCDFDPSTYYESHFGYVTQLFLTIMHLVDDQNAAEIYAGDPT